MTGARGDIVAGLKTFLRTIQKPHRPVDSIQETDGLVASGLIDSLAIVQIVMYLESSYGIDFADSGVDPDRFASISSITDLVLERCA